MTPISAVATARIEQVTGADRGAVPIVSTDSSVTPAQSAIGPTEWERRSAE